jgi:hypothetical protein
MSRRRIKDAGTFGATIEVDLSALAPEPSPVVDEVDEVTAHHDPPLLSASDREAIDGVLTKVLYRFALPLAALLLLLGWLFPSEPEPEPVRPAYVPSAPVPEDGSCGVIDEAVYRLIIPAMSWLDRADTPPPCTP